MSANVFDGASGPIVAQHHDKNWPSSRRQNAKMVRLTGRSDPTKSGTSGNEFERLTLGYYQGGLCWLADYSGPRGAPLWSPAFAAKLVSMGTGTQSDPYKSKVTGTGLAAPSLRQSPGGGDWDSDTSLVPQKVALPFGQDIPAGTPGIAFSFTHTDEQQAAFISGGGVCIAVHWGGPPNGKYGSRVYDVTLTGELDKSRWAREQSQRRVYRLPETPQGFALPFTTTVAATTTSGPSTLPPGGLAWQLGFDVDSQAGHGVCADIRSKSGEPVDPDKTTDGGEGTGGGSTVSKGPVPGSIEALRQGPAKQKDSKFANGAGKLKVTFYGGFGTSSYTVPWDGSQAALDWLRKNGEQAGYAAGGRLSSVEPEGPVAIPQTVSPPPAPVGGNPGTATKPPEVQVLAVATYRGHGPFDCGADGDPHEIVRTPDKEAVNSLHIRETALYRGDTGDAPLKFDKFKWKKICPDGPFWLETYLRNDTAVQHPWLLGPRQGLRKWQTSYYFSSPTPEITDGPNPGTTTGPPPPGDGGGGGGGGGGDRPGRTGGGGGGQVVDTQVGQPQFGGAFRTPGFSSGSPSLAQDPSAPSRALVDGPSGTQRRYIATPLEAAFSTLIARPWTLSPGIKDARGQFAALDEIQQKVYDTAPAGARLEAVSNQTSYVYQRLGQTGAAQYTTGVSDVSGFALTPSNQSVYDRLRGGRNKPSTTSNQAFFTFEANANLGFGDTTIGGRPANGAQWGRSYNATTGDKFVSMEETNASGQPVDAPVALLFDFLLQKAYLWGVEIATGAAGGNGSVNRRLTTNLTIADGYSLVVSEYYDIAAGVALTLAGDAVLHII